MGVISGEKMVLVEMTGGLGNQMFQYAFQLSMKAKGKKCKIDDTLFYITKMHNLSLIHI